jgi:hypothetical protein
MTSQVCFWLEDVRTIKSYGANQDVYMVSIPGIKANAYEVFSNVCHCEILNPDFY